MFVNRVRLFSTLILGFRLAKTALAAAVRFSDETSA
jgi:hypothetical protein